MTTRIWVMVSATIEAATGLALIAVPEFVAHWLLGAELSAAGIAVARVAGFGLLSLAIACWSGANEATAQATRALFVYNLLAGLYLGYLRASGGFVSLLLWPACLVHILIALLLARPAFDGASTARVTRANHR
jgi:hypothetical protein